MFDITPLENLFIDEYMLRAPGSFVKVYIYGLRQCYHGEMDMDLSRMARALDMDEEAVRNAFTYWERQGVLCRVSDNPPCYQYFNLKQRLISERTGDDGFYRYKDFNQRLQALFGSDRLIQSGDLSTVYDWIEVFNLPQDVVLALVEYLIGKRGFKFRFGSCTRVAQEWASKGIRTVSDAREYMRTVSTSYTDMKKVLKRLNISAEPTVDQQELYEKWASWGFGLPAILECCKETAKARNASPGYLDGILSSLHARDLHALDEVSASFQANKQQATERKEVLRILGQTSLANSDAYATMYEKWLGLGFNAETLVLVATNTVQRGTPGSANIDGLNAVLSALHRAERHSAPEIAEYFEEVDRLNDIARTLLERCGEERKPTPSDRGMIKRWRNELEMPIPVIELAAEKAASANGHRFAYMDGILKRWNAAGVFTLEAARADAEAFSSTRQQSQAQASNASTPGRKPTGKELDASFYDQRKYEDGELSRAVTSDIFSDDFEI